MTESTDPLADFEALQARMESITREASENTIRAARFVDETKRAEAIKRSPGGEVTVIARAGGVVVDIKFSEKAYTLATGVLAKLVVSTIAEAQHSAANQVAELAGQEFGEGSSFAESLRIDAERSFPVPPSAGSGGVVY